MIAWWPHCKKLKVKPNKFIAKRSHGKQLKEQFRSEFPGLTKVLIEERDQFVANALHFILNDIQGQIVAVLGAGHIQGVKSVLQELLSED